MAVWPPKLVSVTLYPSLTSTLSSTALAALSSRVRGVGQWKVKEGEKNHQQPFSATWLEQKKAMRRKWRLSGHIRLSPERRAEEEMSGRQQPRPHPQPKHERRSLASQ